MVSIGHYIFFYAMTYFAKIMIDLTTISTVLDYQFLGVEPLKQGATRRPLVNNDQALSESVSPAEDGKATASFVLGIIGMVAWFIPLFGFPITITGLVLGVKASPTKKRETGINLCTVGLILTSINSAIGAYLAYSAATGQGPV